MSVGVSRAAAPWLPDEHAAMVDLASKAIFPCMLLGTLLAQQPTPLVVSVGQAILWLSVAAAAEIVFVLQGAGRTVLLTLGLAVALRVVRGGSSGATLVYELTLGWLYAAAGAAMLLHRPEVLRRQMRAFLLLSIPLMVLQIYGEPGWVYAARLAEYDAAAGALRATLFEPEGLFPAIQARPSGILSSSALLSLVVTFILVLVLADRRARRLSLADGALVAVVVLASAKIVYLTFLILSVAGAMAGPGERRRHIAKLWMLLGIFLGIFYLFFPGVVTYNLSPSRALFNYAIRAADFHAALSGTPTTQVTVQGLGGLELTSGEIPAGSQSAYSKFAWLLPFVAVIVVLLVPFYVRRMSALRAARPELAELARNGLLFLALMPLITSFVGTPLFSFGVGAAALPWLASLHPSVPGTRTR
jgi:hypothetical protein